ncbi:MAG: hypothetical protein ACRD4I_00930 [Candidatus Angelobacter sp.]
MAKGRQHNARGESGIPNMLFSPYLDALLSPRQQQDHIENIAIVRHI